MFHLHLHSKFSLKDSIIRPEELAEYLKEIGQNGCAITDHGNLYAGVSIYKLFKKSNLKYVHGIEFYIYDEEAAREKDNRYYHLIALAKNNTGRLNINRLVSLSNLPEHFYFKPRITFDMLSQYGDGLIICSACMAGELSKFLMSGNYDEAKRRALMYKERFGEDYYIEIQAHNDADQIKLNKQLVELAKECGVELIVTTDAHYLKAEDQSYQNIHAFGGTYAEDGESYVDCFVQSEEEIRQRLNYLPEETINTCIKNTDIIAEKCNVELPLSDPIMPDIDTKRPPEFKNNREWLHNICREGCHTKLGFDIDTLVPDERCRVPDEAERQKYKERYFYEIDSLEKMGFVGYILLVYTYSNVGKRRSKGRGSGGGSLVDYLSNITDIDPIEHNLMFERFIDVGALELLEKGEITAKELKIPDIDLDFSGADCEKVLKWLRDTYGAENVASIGRFGNVYTKSLVRDIGKLIGMDLAATDVIAKSFNGFEIADVDFNIERGKIPPEMQAAAEFVQKYPRLFQFVRKLYGLPKSFGLHPCGKVVSTAALDNFLPSCYDSNGVKYLQGDEHDVEDVGLVKVDILGLRTLDQEYDTLELSGEDESFIDPKQPYDDDKVFEIFRSGDTTGIFQFSSEGMKNTLRKMNPSTIDELSAANAMFRPGPMANIDTYCNRKNGKEQITYLHPDLEPILKNTFGVIVFQEQIIEIGRMAGIHNPDRIRKGMAKKIKKILDEVEPELKQKLHDRGWSVEQANALWDEMERFGAYAFNKSHSSAYAILAYMTAKQKAYYPAEFFAGLLSSYVGESNFIKDISEEIFRDIAKHKISYVPLSFRNDHRKCSVVDGKIVYAIPLIRNLNTTAANLLYSEKDYEGKTFWRLAKRLYDKGMRRASFDVLVMLDFFSEFGNSVKLRRVLDALEFLDWGMKVSVKKVTAEKVTGLSPIIAEYSNDLLKNGGHGQSYKDIDIERVMDKYETLLRESSIPDASIKVKIVNQREYIGLAPFPTGKEEDRPILYIKGIQPLCRKSDAHQFGYSVFTSSLGSGIQSRFSIKGAEYRAFKDNPIAENDIIKCLSWENEKGYPVLKSWTQIYV